MAWILSFCTATFACLVWTPGTGDVATLDAFGLVEAAEVL